MRKLILLLTLIIIPLISLSQNGYPKEIVLKGDSVIAFTYGQVKEINKAIVELEETKKELIIADSIVSTCDSMVSTGTVLIHNLNTQISLYKTNEDYYKKIQLQLESDLEKERKRKKTNTILGTIGGAVGGALIASLIFMLVK